MWEPVTEKCHIKFDLMKRFMNFTDKIIKSKKDTLIYVYKKIHQDVQSVTGRNLNKISQLSERQDIKNVKPSDCDKLVFRNIPAGEEWRVNFIQELIDVKNDVSNIENLSAGEIEEILHFICTSGPS